MLCLRVSASGLRALRQARPGVALGGPNGRIPCWTVLPGGQKGTNGEIQSLVRRGPSNPNYPQAKVTRSQVHGSSAFCLGSSRRWGGGRQTRSAKAIRSRLIGRQTMAWFMCIYIYIYIMAYVYIYIYMYGHGSKSRTPSEHPNPH